ncbi:MAG: helix-turn-helix domain-containing protein [Polyangiales bacterium]
MMRKSAARKVALLALDGMVIFDFATPWDVLRSVREFALADGYELRVCGAARDLDLGGFSLRAHHGLAALAQAHTIIVPGVTDLDAPCSPNVLRALRAAAARGARIASICSGAFVLAQAGLLDGKRATTHWRAASELARRYPAIEVDPSVLYVDNGQILTSAGFAAGLDVCLYLIRRDFGAAVATEVARIAVMPLERAGGQSQFISHAPPTPDGASLEPLLGWMQKNLHSPLSLRALAQRAGLSERTLSRRFREQTGTTPLHWLRHARVRRAQQLLETTSLSIESVAAAVGFGSASTLRQRFQHLVVTSPREYRRAFRPEQR